MEVVEQIKNEIENYKEGTFEIVPNLTYNPYQILNRVYFYYNSKFETGEIDEDGDKKYFFNINRAPCNVATKMIDFDTKDIRILTAEGGSLIKTWLFERDLRFWMKDKGFGLVLNRLFYELPIFGTVVLKIVNNDIYFVDLRNFFVDPNADDLDKASYIIEVHYYTSLQFQRIAQEKKWENWQEVIDVFGESEEESIKVYERYGETGDENGFTYKRSILAQIEDKWILLEEKEVDKHPYWEFHWEKIPGRWLGVGRVEILFDPQIRLNEVSNQQVKSSYWSTLRLWQTRDPGTNRNLLTDVRNGEVLTVDSEIIPIDMADRNLSYYSQEITKWLTNRDEVTFSYDVLRGERLPAGTPLGSAQLAAGMATSYFDQIRENIAMRIKELFYEVIIPQFAKERSQEHILRIAGEDLDKMNTLCETLVFNNLVFDYISRTGKYPNSAELKLFKGIANEKIKRSKEKFVKIPADFYEDIKYKIDIDIVGEAIDTRVRAVNRWLALQAITADPTLLSDPTKRKIFAKYLEDGGISLYDLEVETPTTELTEVAEEVRVKGAGGGVSRPTVPTLPVAGPVERRV